jgi:hypothetical protein
VELSHDGLDFVPGMLLHLQDNDTMDFVRYFDGIGDVIGFWKRGFRICRGLTFKEETAAFFQGLLCGTREVIHTELGVRPDSHWRERPSVRVSQQDHGTPHPLEQAALQRQPALTECLRRCGLCELSPKGTLRVTPMALSCSAYRA